MILAAFVFLADSLIKPMAVDTTAIDTTFKEQKLEIRIQQARINSKLDSLLKELEKQKKKKK